MQEDAFVPISLDTYFLFLAFLVPVIAAVLWWVHRREKQVRRAFFDQHNVSDMRMSAHRVGLVYKVVATEAEGVTVVPIWNGKRPVTNGKAQRVKTDALIPFDETRFFW